MSTLCGLLLTLYGYFFIHIQGTMWPTQLSPLFCIKKCQPWWWWWRWCWPCLEGLRMTTPAQSERRRFWTIEMWQTVISDCLCRKKGQRVRKGSQQEILWSAQGGRCYYYDGSQRFIERRTWPLFSPSRSTSAAQNTRWDWSASSNSKSPTGLPNTTCESPPPPLNEALPRRSEIKSFFNSGSLVEDLKKKCKDTDGKKSFFFQRGGFACSLQNLLQNPNIIGFLTYILYFFSYPPFRARLRRIPLCSVQGQLCWNGVVVQGYLNLFRPFREALDITVLLCWLLWLGSTKAK